MSQVMKKYRLKVMPTPAQIEEVNIATDTAEAIGFINEAHIDGVFTGFIAFNNEGTHEWLWMEDHWICLPPEWFIEV